MKSSSVPAAVSSSIALARAASEPWVALSREGYPEYHEFLAALFSRTKIKPRIVEQRESAASLVSDGDSIFIGSGSTCAYLARHLAAALWARATA